MNNDQSETSDSTTPVPPDHPSNRPGKWLRNTTIVVLSSVLIGCLLVFVVQPLLQEQAADVDGPNLSTNTDDGSNRGSLTDELFQTPVSEPEHPLDLALGVARKGLDRIRSQVQDYTALMVKQERIDGKLLPEEFMRVKVRHSNTEKGIDKAFYVRHVKPKELAGQEAIWCENQNDGKLIAHGVGLQRFFQVNLEPTSWIAMRNNRYPITELGIENLIVRMLEKGGRDRGLGDCQVEYSRDIEFDGNPCTLITMIHPEKLDKFEFYIVKIYIDDKLQLPVGYEGYIWPDKPGDPPVLLERYFYRELKINVGLQPIDFDPANPDYDYP